MRYLFSLLLLICNVTLWSAPATAATMLRGEVLEIKRADSYTDLRLKTVSGGIWSAVATAPVEAGATGTIEDAEQMDNFESKRPKRTHSTTFFGTLAATPGASAAQLSTAKVGDIALLTGTVRKDRDHGSGYAYKVLIEDAKLQK